MREAVDAGGGELERVVVIENVCRDLEAEPVALLDRRTRQRNGELRRAATAVVDPDLDDIDLLCGLLLHGASRLSLGRDLVGEIGIDGIARTGVRRAHAAAGEQEARAAKAAGGPIL